MSKPIHIRQHLECPGCDHMVVISGVTVEDGGAISCASCEEEFQMAMGI